MLYSKSRFSISGVACLGCFLIGLVFVTGAGEYWLALFDKYGAMGLTLIALIEIVATMYVYGHARFVSDVQQMTGYTLGWYWKIMWRFVAPLMLGGLLIISMINQFKVMSKKKFCQKIRETFITYIAFQFDEIFKSAKYHQQIIL